MSPSIRSVRNKAQDKVYKKALKDRDRWDLSPFEIKLSFIAASYLSTWLNKFPDFPGHKNIKKLLDSVVGIASHYYIHWDKYLDEVNDSFLEILGGLGSTYILEMKTESEVDREVKLEVLNTVTNVTRIEKIVIPANTLIFEFSVEDAKTNKATLIENTLDSEQVEALTRGADVNVNTMGISLYALQTLCEGSNLDNKQKEKMLKLSNEMYNEVSEVAKDAQDEAYRNTNHLMKAFTQEYVNSKELNYSRPVKVDNITELEWKLSLYHSVKQKERILSDILKGYAEEKDCKVLYNNIEAYEAFLKIK